jgi:hypothetical protein
MKPFAACLLLAMSAVALAQDNSVQVVQGNQAVVAAPQESAFRLIELVESSSVNSTDYINPQNAWTKTANAPTRVQAHFSPARRIEIIKADQSGRAPESIEDILFTVQTTPFPDHILLKTSRGYQSVAKYSPCAAAKFSLAAGLTFPNFDFNSFLKKNCSDHTKQ